MRLVKFLVIHNDLIKNTNLFMPVLRTRKKVNNSIITEKGTIIYKSSSIITTQNKMYLYRYNKSREAIALESLDIVDNSEKAIAFMSIDYPNEDKEFGDRNKAYVIINLNEIENVMKLISPIVPTNRTTKTYMEDDKEKVKEVYANFQGCIIKDCNYCNESCKNKNISINISSGEKYIRGKTWSYANDKAGTKYEITDYINGVPKQRKIEPKTGGIAYSSIQWEKGIRPELFKAKTIAVPLHHWIKCHSIPNKPIKKGDYSFYHIGHTFDYRKEFIGLATKREQESLRKEIEPKNNIHRGRRVLAGQEYFSRTLSVIVGLPKVILSVEIVRGYYI